MNYSQHEFDFIESAIERKYTAAGYQKYKVTTYKPVYFTSKDMEALVNGQLDVLLQDPHTLFFGDFVFSAVSNTSSCGVELTTPLQTETVCSWYNSIEAFQICNVFDVLWNNIFFSEANVSFKGYVINLIVVND